MALGGPPVGAARTRRPSVLDSHIAPSELLAAGADANGQLGIVGGLPGARGRARTNSSLVQAGGARGGGVGGGAGTGTGSDDNDYGQAAGPDAAELQNERAVEVLDRVQQKLTGRDFRPDEELEVDQQVTKLINEATKLENLCQHYIGWCSFW